jgi:tRNA(adenine34) deaminase
MITPKKEFMTAAIEEALKAKESGDHAIGAVIVKDDQIIARSPMRTRRDEDATQHPEMAVIRGASIVLGKRHLFGCVMYTTHEPCPMCATASVWARLDCVVVGARMSDMDEHRSGNTEKNYSWRTVAIPAREIFEKGDPKVEVVEDFMRDECKALFSN